MEGANKSDIPNFIICVCGYGAAIAAMSSSKTRAYACCVLRDSIFAANGSNSKVFIC